MASARKKPSRSRKRKWDEIREHSRVAYRAAILEAAERVFAEHGFKGTRMADVAREAGVATGTLYNYFASKNAVLRALLEMRSAAFTAVLTRIHDEAEDPLERIQDMVRACFEYLERHRASYAVFEELGALSESSIERIGGEELVGHYDDYLALFEQAIAEAIRAGALRRAAPPGDLAAFLTGAMNGMMRPWFLGRKRIRVGTLADRVVNLFVSGVGTKT